MAWQMRRPNVQAFLLSMSAQQFQSWLLRDKDFGETRADYRIALLAAEVANLSHHVKYRRTPKDDKMFRAEEFLLAFGAPEAERPRSRRTAEEEARDIKRFITALTGVMVE